MRKLISFLPIILLLASCGGNRQEHIIQNDTLANKPVDSVAVVTDPKNNSNVQLNTFSEIDTSGILFFPISEKSDGGGKRLSYSSGGATDFWNIVFLNSRTNEYHLLDTGRMRIKSYYFKSGGGTEMPMHTKNNIYYDVITDDYNSDNKLTDDDPKYLFISDKEGNHFRRISPRLHHVLNWQFIRSTNKIIMTLTKDTDRNHAFGENDEVVIFEIFPDRETEPREIFSTEFKNKLKLLYNKQWKKTEK